MRAGFLHVGLGVAVSLDFGSDRHSERTQHLGWCTLGIGWDCFLVGLFQPMANIRQGGGLVTLSPEGPSACSSEPSEVTADTGRVVWVL